LIWKLIYQHFQVGSHGVVPPQEERKKEIAREPEVAYLQIVRVSGHQIVQYGGTVSQVLELVRWPTSMFGPDHFQGTPIGFQRESVFRPLGDSEFQGGKGVSRLIHPISVIHTQEIHGPDPLQTVLDSIVLRGTGGVEFLEAEPGPRGQGIEPLASPGYCLPHDSRDARGS
jgi:hypothetical protein